MDDVHDKTTLLLPSIPPTCRIQADLDRIETTADLLRRLLRLALRRDREAARVGAGDRREVANHA